MTTATDRRAGPRGSAVRCARAVVVALLAALAVLVHHDTMSVVMPVHSTSAMAGMDHTSAAMTPTAAPAAHGTALKVANTAMGDDGGACPGPGMQHCSAGDVGTAKLLPSPAAVTIVRSDALRGMPARRDPTGTSHRAPPDLSVLSRLLI
ncbi:MAG: hypothetical protein JF597_17820 [Streptomyces sp.]|uniref:hypothetical protein n=1 Tax=Streptomyces sp. TaxID=1931 RepID=UPI0025D8D0DD|nr:hypothetical protein [Streptomyces sp.]MBW8795383.1 hypothetical protein [Streptomyces sp.]